MIRPVRYSAILDDPNADALLAEYAQECVVPDYRPQRQMYENMDAAGILHCFGAYASGRLIGFVTVISCVMPHNGKKTATIESIFVMAKYRDTGAGLDLIDQAEIFAKEDECVALLASPRVDSRMGVVLSRRKGWEETHVVHTKWI